MSWLNLPLWMVEDCWPLNISCERGFDFLELKWRKTVSYSGSRRSGVSERRGYTDSVTTEEHAFHSVLYSILGVGPNSSRPKPIISTEPTIQGEQFCLFLGPTLPKRPISVSVTRPKMPSRTKQQDTHSIQYSSPLAGLEIGQAAQSRRYLQTGRYRQTVDLALVAGWTIVQY